ncbi:MAG: hypothetical protein K9K67_06830 [Bacteriovoracaceae bacterium]|nr:hypothetical protein [Bacteriovoracaceae bacterium]
MNKGFIYLLLFSLLFSCGEKAEEVASAIDEANFLLTDRQCSQARTVLDAVGYQSTNERYIAAYATTYACEANYSTINFFANDLTNLNSTASGFFGSLAGFSTSGLMTSATDTDFLTLQQAIDTILYSGSNTTSSSANRIATFGLRNATNLNVQALYMILVNLGRWLNYHGNADSLGNKGVGTNAEANNCLYTYNTGGANFAVVTDALNDGAAQSGTCNSTNTPYNGTNDISTGDPVTNKQRLCRGIVLLNNFIDIIINVNFTGSNTGQLNTLATTFNTLCQDVTQFADALCDLRDMAGCEATSIDDLEVYTAWLFERNFN